MLCWRAVKKTATASISVAVRWWIEQRTCSIQQFISAGASVSKATYLKCYPRPWKQSPPNHQPQCSLRTLCQRSGRPTGMGLLMALLLRTCLHTAALSFRNGITERTSSFVMLWKIAVVGLLARMSSLCGRKRRMHEHEAVNMRKKHADLLP